MHGSLTIAFVAVYDNQVQPDTFIDAEHVWHQIVAGEWDFRMDGRHYVIGPGALVLLPPCMLHTVRPQGPDPHVLNVCHFLVNDPLPVLAKAPLVVTADAAMHRHLGDVFRELLAEWNGTGLHRPMLLQALLYQILAHYLRLADAATDFEPHQPRGWQNVADAITFMQDRYRDGGLSIDAIADAAGMSRAHFSRIFRQCIGMSPWQYLCRFRIERAKELLKNGKLSCAKVATATGHADVIGFSRAFRRLEGMPPTRWLESTLLPSAR